MSDSSPGSSSELSMPDPFSHSTKANIRVVCRSRYVICSRRVGTGKEIQRLRAVQNGGVGIAEDQPHYNVNILVVVQ